MAKKISQEEFEKKIKHSNFQIINYSSISKKCRIKCLKCGKISFFNKASSAIKHFSCCNQKENRKSNKIIKCSNCGFIFKETKAIKSKNNICPKCHFINFKYNDYSR